MHIHVHIRQFIHHLYSTLPGVAGVLCGVVTVREPPTVGEERRGVEVGTGRRGDGEEGRTDDVARGEV